MDHSRDSAPLRDSLIPTPSSNIIHEGESAEPMAPVIVEEDANIVSAAIITLGDDSSDDEALQLTDNDEQEETVEVAEFTDNVNTSERSASFEEDTSSSDETVVYVDEQHVLPIPVAEILVDPKLGARAAVVEDEIVVNTEIQTSVSRLEYSADEELLIDVEDSKSQQHTLHAQRIHDDGSSESSLLDAEIPEELIETSGSDVIDWAQKQTSSHDEDMRTLWEPNSPSQPMDYSEEHVFKSKEFLDSMDVPGRDSDSDKDSFQSFDSDEEEDGEMDVGNKRIWKELKREKWVAKGFSSILDPKANENERVPMPISFKERKRALIELVMLLSKILFFIDLGVRRNRIFALIPERFWLLHFTWTDTRQLLDARDKELCIGVLSRTKTVLEEWSMVYGFPRVPETLNDAKAAATEAGRSDRTKRVEELLQKQSHKSDRWLRHIFLDFIDYLHWEDILKAESDARRVTIQKVVTMTELCFEQPISIVEEFQDAKKKRECMKKLIDQQLHAVLARTGKLRLDG